MNDKKDGIQRAKSQLYCDVIIFYKTLYWPLLNTITQHSGQIVTICLIWVDIEL